MQQETPEGSQSSPQTPPSAPVPQPQPAPPQGETLYQPSAPAPYVVPPVTAPSPYDTPAANAFPPESLTWEASEYIHTAKGGLWFTVFGLGVAALLVLAIWLQVWTFVALILVMAAAVVVFAFRPPRVLHYTLNDNGVQIGDKTFNFSDYRAFGILEDGAFFTMTLIPVKRFAPALSVYFSEEQGEHIIDIVSAHLPMEHIEPDIIDRVTRRLHF